MKSPTEVEFMRLITNTPMCAKCKKPVDEAEYTHDPIHQLTTCKIRCHGKEVSQQIPDVELIDYKGTSIVVFSGDCVDVDS